jgi:hypothetical protein
LDGAAGLENTWKIRRDEDDLDIEDRKTSSSREEGNEDKNSCNGKNHKKKRLLILLIFKVGVDRSIKFIECQVFINVARLIDILKEYKAIYIYIYIYHLKKCTYQKKNLELHVRVMIVWTHLYASW